MEKHAVCPWCDTEIVWDEELGPEEFCPHCENDLKAYRTVSFSVDNDGGEAVEGRRAEAAGIPGGRRGAPMDDELDGYRHTSSRLLLLEEKLERILDGQEEVPECPECREFMVQAGTQTIADERYRPTLHEAVGQPLLPGPFQLVWYVCPSCFHTQNRLSSNDRDGFLKRLGADSL
ncbi:MAG TPA: hypothetical protein VMS09_07030 [Paenibacillus sp.]|uniref:hypothetical protein n=1 Tax=Paenibacillus sp. TaxID=58172 RepID=UPI002C0FA21E|nr:hypothetical protein [Paenibacillus sp.]HUC91765.1 hypothetical protein [Paenibacillus sp.]